MLKRILDTTAPKTVILIRLVVGGVFLSEGIQKFLFPMDLGVGRFIKIGIPAAGMLAPFVGIVEIICGLLLLAGLLVRLATIPLIVDMMVALASTKLSILVKKGFGAMAHEARTDFCMLIGSIFLLFVGAGAWSFDKKLSRMLFHEK